MGSPLAAWGPVRQLGYVVQDLDAAVEAWSGKLGVGPWTLLRNVELQCAFRGQPTAPVIDLALSYRGEVQVELIQQKNDAASPYRGFIEQGRYGLHHVAFLTEAIDADVALGQQAGLVLACDIRMPARGGRYVYFDTPVPGEQAYIELLQATAVMKQMFAAGIADAKAWQGEGKPVEFNLGPLLKLLRWFS